MEKYHIGRNGPAQCNARKRPCPIGGVHYSTLSEAESEYHKNHMQSEKMSKTFKSDKEFTKKSKELSYILRHKPDSIGMKVNEEGFGKVADVLSGMGINSEQLREIIELDSKGRFEYSASGNEVRARQGHSFKVDLKLEFLSPPDVLYHGTTVVAWQSIKNTGLKAMQRHAVHLSESVTTAENVAGRRKGEVIILSINAKEMFDAGFKFNRTVNNVWLTHHVPPAFITPII